MSTTNTTRPESGLRNHRVEFAREDDFGSVTDPEFKLYADDTNEHTWAPGENIAARRTTSDADPKEFLKAPEADELTIAYDLHKAITDGNDAAYDGMARDADNSLPNSHTVVYRMDRQTAISADETVNGSTAYATRIYTVGRGGLIATVAATGDPSSAQPVQVELTYQFQKVRSYQIDQPHPDESSDTELTVVSDDSGDTTQSVTIEGTDSGGADVSEDVSLNGTTVVSTTNTYATIDAIELDTETTGDVTVSINDGSSTSPTEGDSLAVIQGSDSYDGVEGDLGVPALDSGSRESASSLGSVETFIGDTIKRATNPVPHEVASMTVEVSNNVTPTPTSAGFGQSYSVGNRDTTATLNLFGESHTHHLLTDHYTNTAKDLEWALSNSTITFTGATLTSPGERAASSGESVLVAENGFSCDGITFA